jgi:UDP-2,4-diacetamido-2,4,6-trideoxy-beta-L-altropyranose hydrolase
MAETLLIRADAAPEIGAGHVMRCLALAQAWKGRGGEAVFIGRCEAPALRARLAREGFRLLPVPATHPDPADLAATLAAVRDTGASWVVLDGYGFDAGFQRGVRESGAKVLVLDDYRHLPEYHADLVLNQNIGAEDFDYGLGRDGQALLGCRYAMLRTEFLRAGEGGREPANGPLRVLVTLGGADAGNVTGTVLDALAGFCSRDFRVRAVAGPANPNVDRLREQAAALGDFGAIVEGADMPAEMAHADFAVTAAGSTCWELLYLGVPLACLVLADNQAGIAAGLDRAGAAVSLGRAGEISAEGIAARVAPLLRDPAQRAEMVRRGRELVDGRGARRVCQALEERP